MSGIENTISTITNDNKQGSTTATPVAPGNANYSIKKLSIIIPAYNEEKTITVILDKINEVKLIGNIEKEVIVVNDCSKDRTEEVLQNYIATRTDLTIKYFKYL